MFDDFRKQADDSAMFAEQPELTLDTDLGFSEPRRNFLGMTAPQRFIIALMLLMMTCILGSFFLLVTEKLAPSFLG